MKKYTASEIVKRAYDLADITNTDFLTHDENIHYINDAWKMVYQWIINKGDKQFIKQVGLGGGGFGSVVEYNLPDDMYQMLTLRTSNGAVIGRKSDSESSSSGTYDIINDKLVLYGCPGNLVLEYYSTPVWITYPDKDIEISNVSDVVASFGNSVLTYTYDNQGGAYKVVNVMSGDTLYSWDNDNMPSWYDGDIRTVLRDGYVLHEDKYSAYYATDLLGNIIDEGEGINGDKAYPMVDLVTNNVYIKKGNYVVDMQGNRLNDTFSDWKQYKYGELYISVSGGVLYWSKNGLDGEMELDYRSRFSVNLVNRNTISIGSYEMVMDDEQNVLSVRKVDMDYPLFIASLDYGILEGNYTSQKIKSRYEDTIFNFPNEIYVELLSCDLAVRYMMKMNADPSGLNNQYEAMKNTFMNTLSQSSMPTRITNYYRS